MHKWERVYTTHEKIPAQDILVWKLKRREHLENLNIDGKREINFNLTLGNLQSQPFGFL
jgi:hypothetical protein